MTDPEICKFCEYDDVNAYDAVTTLFEPYGPNTFDAVTNEAESANDELNEYELLTAYDAVEAKLEDTACKTYEAV